MELREILRAGRKSIEENLPEHGIPEYIFNSDVEELVASQGGATFQEFLVRALAAIDSGSYRAIFLTGTESVRKDITAAFVLYHYAALGRKILYKVATGLEMDEELAPAHAIAILASDTRGLVSTKVKSIIRNQIGGNRVVILGTSGLGTLETALGASTVDYLCSVGIELVVPGSREDIPVVS